MYITCDVLHFVPVPILHWHTKTRKTVCSIDIDSLIDYCYNLVSKVKGVVFGRLPAAAWIQLNPATGVRSVYIVSTIFLNYVPLNHLFAYIYRHYNCITYGQKVIDIILGYISGLDSYLKKYLDTLHSPPQWPNTGTIHIFNFLYMFNYLTRIKKLNIQLN